jgi:aromatic-L-amino-acid decarboxylase
MADDGTPRDRRAPIDLPPERFRSAGHALIDRIADLLATSRERPVTAGLSVSVRKRRTSSTSGPRTLAVSALKVWMALRQVGRRGYQRMIGDDIELARALHERLAEDPQFEAATHSLSITTFRYVPEDYRHRVGDAAAETYLNQLNEALQGRLEASGELFVSNAVIDGRYLLHACIVNFRTSMRDIVQVLEIVSRHGRQVHAELQRGR